MIAVFICDCCGIFRIFRPHKHNVSTCHVLAIQHDVDHMISVMWRNKRESMNQIIAHAAIFFLQRKCHAHTRDLDIKIGWAGFLGVNWKKINTLSNTRNKTKSTVFYRIRSKQRNSNYDKNAALYIFRLMFEINIIS